MLETLIISFAMTIAATTIVIVVLAAGAGKYTSPRRRNYR